MEKNVNADHDTAPATLGASAHLVPLTLTAVVPAEAASAVTAATPASVLATAQGIPNVSAASAHTAQSSPASEGEASAQSAKATEPQHLDGVQLRVQGNVSELKVSVQLPELGKVEVRAVSTHDSTMAHITAFRHDALPGLSAGRAGLEEALKSHDVILGSLESQTQGHASGQQNQKNSNAPVRAQNNAAPEAAPDVRTLEGDHSGFLPDHISISVRA
jgi:hypothetical protein